MSLTLLKSPTLRAGLSHAAGPLLIALVAWLLVVTHLDPGGSDPSSGEGPGLTIDETFNVQQGVLLTEAWGTPGAVLILPELARDVFHPQKGWYLQDHPPLGRFWLGVHHHLAWWWQPPHDPSGPFVTARARTGSASAFALTILLLGTMASAWYGRTVGVLTALAYATIPRVFGHAHIASLETFTNLTYTAAVLAVAATWRAETAPGLKTAGWTGAIYGLALLSKMQAVFIPIPLAVWALVRWRHRAVLPLMAWGLAAFAVFVVGWPTHWFEPWNSIPKYFRGAADRVALSVWFDGMRYTDKTMPRTYVLMTFLWTVPWIIPVLVMIAAGLARRAVVPRQDSQSQTPSLSMAFLSRSDRATEEWLILLEAIFPLVMFSLPRVPVYDAERLWLPALPLLVFAAAPGIATLITLVSSRAGQRAAIIGLTIVLACPVVTAWRIAPCYLSGFNLVRGGLASADRAGQELDYWSNAITRSLLTDLVRAVPKGSTIAVAPVLHQFQVEEMLTQSPILRAHDVRLVAYDPKQLSAEYVLIYRRRADLDPALEQQLRDGPRLAEVTREGVVLAGLLRVAKPGSR